MLIPVTPHQIPSLVRTSDALVVNSGGTRLEISLKDGRYDLSWEGLAKVHGATSSVRLGDGRERCESDYTTHTAEASHVTDALGTGLRIDLHSLKEGEPELVTSFWLYQNRPEAIVQVSALSPTPISTDRMLPIVADGGVDLDQGDPLQVLFVPFANNRRVRYHSQNWGDTGESYEFGGTYDNRSRHGLIAGSLEHTTWKSAVLFRGRSGAHFSKMVSYAGASDYWTEDREPHGSIHGTELRSPRMSIGAFTDWRDGLESFGRECSLVEPPLLWSGSPPTGWNSWSAVMLNLDESVVLAAADVVKRLGFEYVNMDAGWTNIPDDQLRPLVQRIHAMGLKAGIYGSPFSAWQDSLDADVEGTNGRYKLRDIVLKDHDGNPFPKVDGGWPVDPTHPGTIMRNAWTFARFKRWGFDYVKLDFMEHGALEGRHYDPHITTGIQAYNFGMKQVDEDLKGMFISLSLCPLFPTCFAHSRRISDDTFADVGYSSYMLNAATYSWWMQGSLYPFNDPDHSVIYKPDGSPIVSEADAQTRITASIVAGGMLLSGDDMRNPLARERVIRLFSNQTLVGLAKKGLAFRPVEADFGQWAADCFVAKDGKEFYVAVFNYDIEKTKHVKLDLSRANIPSGNWRATELWSGFESVATPTLVTTLLPRSCAVFRLQL